jgi:hypothetical protein
MKNKRRKQKLTSIERALVGAASMPVSKARKVVGSLLAQLREEEAGVRRALTRNAKDVLYMGKINADNPLHVARYLAQELFDCLPYGAGLLGSIVRWRWKAQRFISQMLIKLSEYLSNGQPMFNYVDVDAANIKKLQPQITVSEIVSKLEKLHPAFTRDALKKRVGRLLKNFPTEYWKPPI